MSDKILGFRDPHAALRTIVLNQGYDNQEDEPLLDVITDLEYDVALMVWKIIQVKLDGGGGLDSDELREFILNHQESCPEVPPKVMYLH